MSKVDRSKYHFNASLYIERREVLYAIRGLSMAVQREVNNKIPWAGATDDAWHKARRVAKFYFTTPEFRAQFLGWVKELIRFDNPEPTDMNDIDCAPEPD
jgi:hypothetical protein